MLSVFQLCKYLTMQEGHKGEKITAMQIYLISQKKDTSDEVNVVA